MDDDDEDDEDFPEDLDGEPAIKYHPTHHRLEVAGQEQLSDLVFL